MTREVKFKFEIGRFPAHYSAPSGARINFSTSPKKFPNGS
jgi:hypothetical protein